MSNNIAAQSVRFADNIYATLIIARACLVMCTSDTMTPTKIKKLDQYAIRV